jgi:dTMP kinase
MPTIIVLEGPDGAGKTATAKALTQRLRNEGHVVLMAREPGFTSVGERIRNDFLLSQMQLTPLSQFYLFQVARMEMLEEFRLKHRHNEYIVLDRFWPSTLAYQVYGDGIPYRLFDAIQVEVKAAVALVGSEIDICLSVPEDVRLQRLKESGKGGDRYESKPPEFIKRVNAAYEDMIKRCLLHPIDGAAEMPTVVDHIYDLVIH